MEPLKEPIISDHHMLVVDIVSLHITAELASQTPVFGLTRLCHCNKHFQTEGGLAMIGDLTDQS